MPPKDVNNIPPFINTAEKWDEQGHYCDCIHKYSNLVYDIEQYNLPQADKKKLIYCLADIILPVMVQIKCSVRNPVNVLI